MAGVKGRSGRKKAPFQEKRSKIIDKAWDLIGERLNDPNLPIEDKIAIARDLAVKSVPQEIEGKGFGGNVYAIIGRIQSDIQENSRPPLALDSGDGLHKG